jgi:hypothetical protein
MCRGSKSHIMITGRPTMTVTPEALVRPGPPARAAAGRRRSARRADPGRGPGRLRRRSESALRGGPVTGRGSEALTCQWAAHRD